MRIPDHTLSEIRDKLDIAEVIGETVTLQRRGGRYWGLCPFHQEKSPSFTVTPDKGVFYCFGCHKGGTVFDFVMEVEKVPWRDAVEILAKKAGIELPRDDEQRDGIGRETFLELYRRVAGSFHWLLMESPQGEPARSYLASRGLSKDTIAAFQLGYAPPDRDWLFGFLSKKSYSPEFLGRTGLFLDNARGRGGSLFASRIMFPIANARGEILAFGGRAMGDAQPKYLNSPETAFFRKGENLFGLDKAASPIRRDGWFILVEGYMDAIAMHQAGIANCVAPLGTALTEQQVRLLKRFASKGVLLFDSDPAGQKATDRAIELLEAQDILVQVAVVEGGKDPADLVQRGQAEALRELLARPQESFPYSLAKALAASDRGKAEGRERIRDALFPFIAAAASPMRKDGYLGLLADNLGVDVGAVRQDFTAWLRRRQPGGGRRDAGRQAVAPGLARPGGTAPAAETAAGAVSSDLFLMLAVAAHRELFSLVRNGAVGLGDLDDERASRLYVALEESFRAEEEGFEALCSRIDDPGLRDLVMRKVASGEFDMAQERAVADGIRGIRQRALRRKRDLVSAEIRRLEKEKGDPARVRDLLAEKMHLDGELERLQAPAVGANQGSAGPTRTGAEGV
ncbi:MAG TPA: DNA primase [Spirochaetia bacterium]|nr:DNA primase [Spirochaetia bacterium]